MTAITAGSISTRRSVNGAPSVRSASASVMLIASTCGNTAVRFVAYSVEASPWEPVIRCSPYLQVNQSDGEVLAVPGACRVSADNWTTCPQCDEKWQRELAKKGAEVDAAYGKVSPDEYEALRSKLKAFVSVRTEETFREDYEVGIDGERFVVDYHGRCTACGFAHKFRHVSRLALTVVEVTE